MKEEETRKVNRGTHKPRSSDSSFYDQICSICGAKDWTAGVDEMEQRPCTGAKIMTAQPIGSSYNAPINSSEQGIGSIQIGAGLRKNPRFF